MKKDFGIILASFLMLSGCNSFDELHDEVVNEKRGLPEYCRTKEDAIKIADNLFSNINGGVTRSSKSMPHIETAYSSLPTRAGEDPTPELYIVSYGSDNGFALISADTRRPVDVYAFSDTGNLSFNDTISNSGLGEYINSIINTPVDTNGGSYGDTRPGIGDVAPVEFIVPPLLSEDVRSWNQITLNKYVRDKAGENTPVGCVALAATQAMCYYEWPDRYPYYRFETATEKYTFDWSILKNYIYHDDIARMLEILGRPSFLNISYSVSGSSAYAYNLIRTFNHFGYYSIREDSLKNVYPEIMDELSQKNILILTGKYAQNKNGHCWTVDGLARWFTGISGSIVDNFGKIYEYYLHFTWGQGWHKGNGYYYYRSDIDLFDGEAKYLYPDEDNSCDHDTGKNEDQTLRFFGGIKVYHDFAINKDRIR